MANKDNLADDPQDASDANKQVDIWYKLRSNSARIKSAWFGKRFI